MTSGVMTGRVAIVTGAGAGLGREHALLLAAQGASVVVNDLHGAHAVADEITTRGGAAVAVECSVTEQGAGLALVDASLAAFGDLHAVVNNAGFIRDALVVDTDPDDFDAVVAVHLKGTFALTQASARFFRQQHKSGVDAPRAIVNTTSAAGLHGNVAQIGYSAAKAGVAMMTVSAGLELKRYGVRTNAIAPAARTAPVSATPAIAAIFAPPDDPACFDRFDPANVSPLVVYLASPACRFNGQVFSVLGGEVGLYAGWSIGARVTRDHRWSVEDLTSALADMPARIAVKRQQLVAREGSVA